MPEDTLQNRGDIEEIQTDITEEATDKKCPNCGATVVYDPATRGLLCEYCGYKKALPSPDQEESVYADCSVSIAGTKKRFRLLTRKNPYRRLIFFLLITNIALTGEPGKNR